MSPLLLALLTACVAPPLPPAGDGSGETGDAASETGTEDTSTEDDEDADHREIGEPFPAHDFRQTRTTRP